MLERHTNPLITVSYKTAHNSRTKHTSFSNSHKTCNMQNYVILVNIIILSKRKLVYLVSSNFKLCSFIEFCICDSNSTEDQVFAKYLQHKVKGNFSNYPEQSTKSSVTKVHLYTSIEK